LQNVALLDHILLKFPLPSFFTCRELIIVWLTQISRSECETALDDELHVSLEESLLNDDHVEEEEEEGALERSNEGTSSRY
jgi:hypothetical protein